MTGAEHYREAERLLSLIPDRIENLGRGLPGSAEIIAQAQAHATLALATTQAPCQEGQHGQVTGTLAEVIAATSGYAQSDGPNDVYPAGGYRNPSERLPYLEAALAGIELGAYDRRIVDWLLQWDDYTTRLVVSLLVRARRAGYAEAAANAPLLPSPKPGISGLPARTPNGDQ